MMKKVPKRRFKGFLNAGDWEQRKLGELCSEFKSGDFIRADEIAETGSYPVFGGNGLRGYTDRYNHDGDFALIGRQGALCGNMNFSSGKAYFTEHAVAVKADKSNDTRFLFYCFGTMNLGQYSGQSAQPGLAVGNLVELETMVPTKTEQECISASLTALDHLITLHQRKLEKLKIVKKAMLENCFPKNGEKVPRFRFSGFTGDWEQRKLGEMLISLQNNTLSRAELSPEQGIAKNVHYGDILVKFGEIIDVKTESLPMIADEAIMAKYKSSFLQNGDVIVADTAEDETVGKCTEIVGLSDEIVISGLHTIPYRPLQKFASGYLGYYMNSAFFHNQLLPLMQGIKVTSISKTALQNTDISYPKSENEQAAIGKYFSRLDHLITLHQRKLEKLKIIKKSFLEKMFV